jgi:hypothetical protein
LSADDLPLLSRNARTNEPDAVHILHKLCSEGKQLQAQRAELAEKVSFAVEASVDALSECVSTIRVAGAFRIFSRRYRNAKGLFLSVAQLFHVFPNYKFHMNMNRCLWMRMFVLLVEQLFKSAGVRGR